VTGGEKQRLAACVLCSYFHVIGAHFKRLAIRARTFMKINHNDIRLVVVDEGMSSLDAVTERDILSEFHRARRGKTMILVTHRFHHLVKEADQIM